LEEEVVNLFASASFPKQNKKFFVAFVLLPFAKWRHSVYIIMQMKLKQIG